MTLGVTIYGAIQNNVFTSKMTDAFKGMQGSPDTAGLMEDPRQLFQSEARAEIPDFILDKIVHAMSDSISFIFTLALIPIGLAAITVFFMGKTRVETPSKRNPYNKQKALHFQRFCIFIPLL